MVVLAAGNEGYAVLKSEDGDINPPKGNPLRGPVR
jgi:hypothetical protein